MFQSTSCFKQMRIAILCFVCTAAIFANPTNAENATDAQDPRSKWTGVEHLIDLNACCNGSNIIGLDGCRDGPGLGRMNCKNKFELEPEENPEDAFEIRSPHHIVVNGKSHEHGSFCHTYLLVDGETNETRPAIIMCLVEAELYYEMFALKGALALVSVVFVLATLYVYYVLKELRQTQDLVTCVMLFCLAALLLFLGLSQTTSTVRIAGICIGYPIYFFSIAYFTWLNVIMLNVWKTTILFRWVTKEHYWYLFNHVYGWSVPTISLLVLLLNSDELIEPMSCWLTKESVGVLFVPMAVLLTFNVVLFGWSAWGIFRSGGDVSPDRQKALKYKFLLYLRLVTLSGTIWFLEFVSFFYGTNTSLTYWILIDCINSLHGVGVFLVLVVFRKNIRRELAGKTLVCNIKFPISWSPVNQDVDTVDRDSRPLK